MNSGDTFKFDQVEIHLWIVISEPKLDPQRVVIVNVTTWQPYHDQACILNVGDHPYIAHKSCINFPETTIVRDADLEWLKARNSLQPHASATAGLLARIRKSVLDSRMPQEAADILESQGLLYEE